MAADDAAFTHVDGELGFDPEEEAIVDPRLQRNSPPPVRAVRLRQPGFTHPVWLLSADGNVPQQPQLVPLGKLIEPWPELLPVFASGNGDWIRDPARGVYVTDSLERRRHTAVSALSEAAAVVIRHPHDPEAADAEAQFESVLEAVVALHWSGEGQFDGIAHQGFQRVAGRVRLAGAARVRQGADRPIRVDVSPVAGGTVMIDRPAPRPRRGLLRRGTDPSVQQGTQLIRIPTGFDALDAG